MNKNPYDENRPNLWEIQDRYNDPATLKLWRAGLLPEQIRLKEEAAEKKRKATPPPPEAA